jgi:glycosyltransferase involved in cell wall biosynthesis
VAVNEGLHQVCAGAGPRDAISHHLLESQRVLQEMGLRSELFCEDGRIHPALTGRVHPVSRWDEITRPGDGAILHYSIASPAFAHVLDRCDRTAIYYHNITPAELLWEDAPAVALQCRRGRAELAAMADRVVAVAAVSSFNAQELDALGFAPARVVGVMRRELPHVPRDGRRDDRLRLLFVGRGVPNKAQHHLIAALAALRQTGTDAALTLVGTWVGMDRYEARCRELALRLMVEDEVTFAGSLNDARLARAYAESDCFVCLSDHEGYCVPLVEAMTASLPIVALAAGAVPETLGRAGLLLDEKPPSLVAEAVLAATSGDPRLSASMAQGRRERLGALGDEAVAERLRAFVEALP